MSFFSKGKEVEVVLFSPLEGQLTYKGQPAVNAKLVLWVAWKDKKGETKTFEADEHGHFSIPAQKTMYVDSSYAQLVIGQKVHVIFNDQEFLIWNGGKSDGELYGELGGKPVGITCEITGELDSYYDHALLGTNCKWEQLIKESN